MHQPRTLVLTVEKACIAEENLVRGLVADLVLRTRVQVIQGRILSLLNFLGRAKPNQNPLRLVTTIRIRKKIGVRVDKVLVPQVRKEKTRTKDRNLTRIILHRVFSRIPIGAMPHILALLRVAM